MPWKGFRHGLRGKGLLAQPIDARADRPRFHRIGREGDQNLFPAWRGSLAIFANRANSAVSGKERRFSHRAEADLFNIGLDTFRTWDELTSDPRLAFS
jgi:hypothetical protein